MPITLLLFVDERPNLKENVEQIHNCLANLAKKDEFDLETIKISDQPQLLELYRLVATPALVKIFPEPAQTLAGSNLVDKLVEWWPKWQAQLGLHQNSSKSIPPSNCRLTSPGYAAELIRLSDEIFSLKKQTEELKQQLQFKDQVLAMLAHDLRSPLTAASIAVETIEISETSVKHNTTKIKKQLFGQLKKQFQIMNRMVGNLLETSKSINSQLQIQPCQLQLQALCHDILEQIKHKIEHKSQRLTIDIPQDLPSVYADEELIRQVLINLLENAIKYTPPQGTIDLSILHRTSQKIQVSVCDTGLGIPAEKQERIFEGHYRLKRDEAKEGYGLGLSLCRKIVSAHYGQIWVNSSEHGSCFYFTLPIY